MESLVTFAAIISVIVGIFALALSIIFFIMMMKYQAKMNFSARGLESNIERLDKFMTQVYHETFMMMRNSGPVDNPNDKSGGGAKPSPELMKLVEVKIDERAAKLKDELRAEMSILLKQYRETDAKVEHIQRKIESLVQNMVNEIRPLEKLKR
jgi:hypothetical protein